MTEADFLTYRFGVNYTPSRNWWFCWNDWDAGAIARDLDSIAGLGVDHLRILLIWPYFQPNATWVSPAHLERLAELMTLAAERQLDVMVAVFTGQLSGLFFVPPFYRDEPFYTSEKMWAAQELFVRALANVLQKHDNFLGFDLGNEINTCWSAELAAGDAWMNRMLTLMETLCPAQVHVNGVDHLPWLGSNTFSQEALVARQPIVALHCWSYWTGALKRGGAFDPPALQLLPAMATLARAWGANPRKPMWVQEYGASDEWMPADRLAEWMERATLGAIEHGVSWFTWWDSHDVDPKLEFISLEYGLGLLTTDNQVKEHGRKFQELAARYRGQSVQLPTYPLPPPPGARTEEAAWAWMLNWIEERP